MIGAKVAKQAANRVEKVVAQSLAPQQDKSNRDNDIPIGESQGGTTITLTLRTPERLYRFYNLISSTISEASNTSKASDSPKSQAQPPASTAPARIEEPEGPRKRRRLQNKLYRESQYEL